MEVIPQVPPYQCHRIGKRRMAFGIPSRAAHATDTFFHQQVCRQGDDRIQAQQGRCRARDGPIIPLALRFHPQMSSRFFKRHFHRPATPKPRHDLLGRLIEVGRPQHLRFEPLLRVSNQPPANRHWRFAGVIPNRCIRSDFDVTRPFPIPLLYLQGDPLGVVIGQQRFPSRAALALEPGASCLSRRTRGSRIIEGCIQTQARDQAGFGQALNLGQQLQNGKATIGDKDQLVPGQPASDEPNELPSS